MARALTLTTLVVALLALFVSGWTAWNLHRSQSPHRVIEARGLIIHDTTGTTEVFKVIANPDRGASLMVKHQNNTGALLSSWQGKPELVFLDDSGQSYYVRPGASAAP